MNRRRVILVGCVKQKHQDRPYQARELYTSPLFRRRRDFAEASVRVRHAERWFILSAAYGLVPPNRVIRPYDLALSQLSRDDRKDWGEHVARDLVDFLEGVQGVELEVHAGRPYVEALAVPVTAHGGILHTPLAGLGIGQQLAWYRRGA